MISPTKKMQARYAQDDARFAAIQEKIDAVVPRVEAAKVAEKEGRVKVGLALRFARTLHKTLRIAGDRVEEVVGRGIGDD